MRPVEASPVLFFYCTQTYDPEQVLRSFVRQLVQLKPGGEAMDAMALDTALSPAEAVVTMRKMLQEYESATVVLDSPENCALPDASSTKSYTYIRLLNNITELMHETPLSPQGSSN